MSTLPNGDFKFRITDTCLQHRQSDGRAQAHQITPHSVSPLIVGWMDHIPNGSKWPSEQRELQPEQILAEWQAVTARLEKNLKNCVDLQEALRVQREVDLAKQEERAEELRYLLN